MITKEEIESKVILLKKKKTKKTQEELYTEAKLLLISNKLDLSGLASTEEELVLAEIIAKKYLSDFEPENESDLGNLKSLIYLELVQLRLQKVMNNLSQDGGNALPLNLVDSIHKNLKEITIAKEKLGLGKRFQEEMTSSWLKYWNMLRIKIKKWLSENQGSRTLVCPHCGKMTLLKIRMDRWEASKHPLFKDRLLTSPHLIKLYKEGKLTKQDVADVLGCSSDYVEWLALRWKKNDEVLGGATEPLKQMVGEDVQKS